MELRTKLISELLKHFLEDLAKSINPLDNAEDKAYFCENFKELAIELYNDQQFDENKFLLDKIYSKFKNKSVPFTKSNLMLYIQPNEYHQTLLFEKLGLDKNTLLNQDEIQELFIHYIHTLEVVPKHLYLHETDGEVKTTNVEDKATQEKLLDEIKEQLATKMPNFNRARQTLIFYYLLKGNKVHKETHNLAAIARFVHHTLGIPYKSIDNSEFYDKLKSAPIFKKETLLLKDLEYVKEQFQTIECPELTRMVEEDISMVQKSLKWR